MLRLRLRIDCHPRAKKGAPPQSTTGVASRSWSQGFPIIPMDTIISGTVSATLTQKRRVMSASSGSGPSSSVTVSGSRAMPHFGHAPGRSDITSGSMGQTYRTGPVGGGAAGRWNFSSQCFEQK